MINKIKILTFIYNEKTNKLFLRHNNPKNPIHGGDIWYTVTGSLEQEDTSCEDAVVREVKEETGLNVYDVTYLNYVLEYNNYQGLCKEYVYISFTKEDNVILNEESIDFTWCSFAEYMEKTHWYSSKNILKKVLKKAIKKETYFKEEYVEKT